MGWLGERTEERADPATLWPEARTVVSLALNYAPADRSARRARAARARGDLGLCPGPRLSRGDEEQAEGARPLHLGHLPHDIKVFVDTAPLMEKPAAQAAGLGWQGKHTNLVSRAVRLVAVPGRAPAVGRAAATTRRRPTIAASAAPASMPARPTPSPRPTGSMRGAASPISPSSTRGRSTRAAAAARQPHLWLRRLPGRLPVEQVRASRRARRPSRRAPTLDRAGAGRARHARRAGFRQRFAGTAIKRIGRDRFMRNVAYALGNSGAPRDRAARRSNSC